MSLESKKSAIEQLEDEIRKLKDELYAKEQLLSSLKREKVSEDNDHPSFLSYEEVSRYSRQMLVPQIGVDGQKKLKMSKVLIVGVGGLGCPAALYLAAAGIGEITLIDDDEVDLTNLHRQILHTEDDVGHKKVLSAYTTLKKSNSNVKVSPLHLHASSETFNSILQATKFDVVIDGSDNVATRYLLNDACVINGIPLVSGSALQLEGQLTVYNFKKGPCYRCLFPIPPPPETVTSCGDGGVLGAVPGVIGVLEALEAIKIIVGFEGVLSGRLLLFDAAESVFRCVKLRNQMPECAVCGDNRTIRKLIDYEQFCGAKSTDKITNIEILNAEENVSVSELAQVFKNNELLIDVRPRLEFEMCHLPQSVNFPLSELGKEETVENLKSLLQRKCTDAVRKVYVMCRRGNDSQRALNQLKINFNQFPVKFYNVKGGLHHYAKKIDNSFPIY